MSDEAETTLSQSVPQTPQTIKAKKPFQWDNDEDLVNETKRLFSSIHNDLIKKTESEVNEILKDLEKVPTYLHKYEKNKSDRSALLTAFSAARSARVKMEVLAPTHKANVGEFMTGLMGGVFMISILWVILHIAFGAFWTAGLFPLDAFFIAFFGAIASSMLYLGESQAARKDTLKAFAMLVASPFVAVVLVVLFSELTFGVGNEPGISSNIGTLTLREASVGLKLAFAFLFGFFGEFSIELLRTIMRQTTTQV